MASDASLSDRQTVLVGLVAAGTLLYSILIAQRLLLGAGLLLWGFFAYLAWRFVRAVERIAAAQERRAGAEEDGGSTVAGRV